jgi:hypothetical protein
MLKIIRDIDSVSLLWDLLLYALVGAAISSPSNAITIEDKAFV